VPARGEPCKKTPADMDNARACWFECPSSFYERSRSGVNRCKARRYLPGGVRKPALLDLCTLHALDRSRSLRGLNPFKAVYFVYTFVVPFLRPYSRPKH
jgi:hypothetical protein